MRLRLGAVDQGEIAEIAAAADVDLEGERLAMDNPLERDELWSGQKVVHDARGGAQPLRHFGVTGAGLIADAGDEAARGLLAETFNQLLPQGAERGHVHEHHALVVEPDAAMAGGETKAVGEIVNLGNADRAGLLPALGSRGRRCLRDRWLRPMDVNVHPSLPLRRFYRRPNLRATLGEELSSVNAIIDIFVSMTISFARCARSKGTCRCESVRAGRASA